MLDVYIAWLCGWKDKQRQGKTKVLIDLLNDLRFFRYVNSIISLFGVTWGSSRVISVGKCDWTGIYCDLSWQFYLLLSVPLLQFDELLDRLWDSGKCVQLLKLVEWRLFHISDSEWIKSNGIDLNRREKKCVACGGNTTQFNEYWVELGLA